MLNISTLNPATAIHDIRLDRELFLDHVLGMGCLARLGDALDYFESKQPNRPDEKQWRALDDLQGSYFSMQRAPFFIWCDTALEFSPTPHSTKLSPLLRALDNEVAKAKRTILTSKSERERVKADLVCWEEWISIAYRKAVENWLVGDQSTMAAIAWASAPVHDLKSIEKKTYTAASLEELERRDMMFDGFRAGAVAQRRENLRAAADVEALM